MKIRQKKPILYKNLKSFSGQPEDYLIINEDVDNDDMPSGKKVFDRLVMSKGNYMLQKLLSVPKDQGSASSQHRPSDILLRGTSFNVYEDFVTKRRNNLTNKFPSKLKFESSLDDSMPTQRSEAGLEDIIDASSCSKMEGENVPSLKDYED